MSWAERAYEYRTNGKGKQEDKEDIANRLIQRRNTFKDGRKQVL